MNAPLSETNPSSSSITVRTVESLKNSNQDFEWYPTPPEMIEVVATDLLDQRRIESVLDIGAGDGRVLNYLSCALQDNGTNIQKYAIEKARPHISSMDKSIFMIGTDFNDQNLIDKKVSAIFCNPPFSEYESWVVKIIKEANASIIYFVIPERWSKSEKIQEAIAGRGKFVSQEVLGAFDFDKGDRGTNYHVKVEILKVTLSIHGVNDPFDDWFDTHFKLDINKTSKSNNEIRCDIYDNLQEQIKNDLVPGSDLITGLVAMYNSDMEDLIHSYQSICKIDSSLLEEMDICQHHLKSSLRLKISSLKEAYWLEFFNRLDKITSRLASETRKRMLAKLTSHTSIEFNKMNAYAVTEWAIKNADDYIEEQFLTITERIFKTVDTINYKSNQRTFKDDGWRYNTCHKDHVVLDYRVVLKNFSAIYNGNYSYESFNGLTESAARFLDDILVMAYNLGFDVLGQETHSSFEWSSGKKHTFHYKEMGTGKLLPLMEAKAFINGNIHFKFNKLFILKLNVEFGRLKGWIKNKEEAFKEMGDIFSNMDNSFKDPEFFMGHISSSFGSTFKLANNSNQLLLELSS